MRGAPHAHRASQPDFVRIKVDNKCFDLPRSLVLRHTVYRALSRPGALLVDGEVAGTWRYRRADHEVTIQPVWTLSSTQQRARTSTSRWRVQAKGAATDRVLLGRPLSRR